MSLVTRVRWDGLWWFLGLAGRGWWAVVMGVLAGGGCRGGLCGGRSGEQL